MTLKREGLENETPPVLLRGARERVAQHGAARSGALTDSIPICVWAACKHGEIHYCNRAWREYAGHDVGLHFLAAVPDDERDEVACKYDEAIRHARPMEWEQRLRRHDGALRWHLCRMAPERDGSGEPSGWLLTATDIDAQKQSQAAHESRLASELELRNLAESASRAKDELLATISHELRTPLAAILGWTSVLRRHASGDEGLTRAVRSIERSASAQRKLLEDVLDAARVFAGKLTVEIRSIDLRRVINEAVDMVQPEADAKGVALEVSLEPGSEELAGDPDRLKQVAWNLLANAIKFTPRGGRVTVRARREGPDVYIEVRDTGIGIAPDFLPQVFDRFRQGHSGRSGRGGLGLGLAIVRDLVELHGGIVRASSEGKGKGATFTLRLPSGASTIAGDTLEWIDGGVHDPIT
jgi:PAS domain S-box-containing protein